LPESGSFAIGDVLVATGQVDDRYAQRTLRVPAGGFTVTGSAGDESPISARTGDIGEATECRLVQISGLITGAPTSLASGLAYEIDDGSGPVRVLVAPAAGIDTSGWVRDATVTLKGVAGQRDSSGTGVNGYRVMPRTPPDILAVEPPAPPTPTPNASPTAGPTTTPTATPTASDSPTPVPSGSPSPSNGPALTSIAQARAAAAGSQVRVRGTVTLPSGLLGDASAVIQDTSAAILVRLGDTAGSLRRGRYVEVVGVRSTKTGMLTIRVDTAPTDLGTLAEPDARRIPTSGAAEALEAQLLVARGAVTTMPLKSTAGNVAFTIDDGSGPLRVTLLADARIQSTSVTRGSWVEIRGVLGQQTTGQQPERGYRLWPRDQADVWTIAAASTTAVQAQHADDNASSGADTSDGSGSSAGQAVGGVLSGVDRPGSQPATPGLGGTPVSAAAIDAGSGSTDGPSVTGNPVTTLLALQPGDRRAAALLLGSLSLLVVLTTLAWRTGTLGRLRRMLGVSTGGLAPTLVEASEGEVRPMGW
jgi:hypothetical protein